MSLWGRIASAIDESGVAALISVVAIEGSAPREAGARIVLTAAGGFFGTIGGGALEHAVLAQARGLLGQGVCGTTLRQSLGPDLGQCCGGQADVSIEVFNRQDMPWIRPLVLAEQTRGYIDTFGRSDGQGRLIRRLGGASEAGVQAGEVAERFGTRLTPVLLFGAGHVGRALVLALAPLPFHVQWIDGRADAFPLHVPGNVMVRCLPEPAAALKGAEPGALVVVMTHSHPLDLALVALALTDARFPYVGLIGSDTKRGRFRSRLRAAGATPDALGRLVCPIGGRRLADKSPAVIAAAVAVELLEAREKGL